MKSIRVIIGWVIIVAGGVLFGAATVALLPFLAIFGIYYLIERGCVHSWTWLAACVEDAANTLPITKRAIRGHATAYTIVCLFAAVIFATTLHYWPKEPVYVGVKEDVRVEIHTSRGITTKETEP